MNNSAKRDQAVEKLLRQPRRAVQAPACLDAETLAAWADGALSGAALEGAEEHVADCARCQAALASLIRLNSAAPPPEPVRAPWWRLAWLVPLTAAAVATAVWVAVPRHSPDDRVSVAPSAEKTASSVPEPTPSAAAPNTPARDNSEKKEVAPEADHRSAELRRETVPTDAAPQELDAMNKQAAAAGKIASVPQAGPTAGATIAGATPSAPAQRADRAFALPRATVLAQLAPIEIVSPDPMMRWRIVGAEVQRSVDGGATWEATSTGTSTPLAAGASPLPGVCWIVGRGGLVLLTTDGRTWRRVPFSESTDLSGVRARDANAAQVTGVDGRIFSTADAGASWAPGPLQGF